MPTAVTANLGFGKHHAIEVEDEVTAMLTYANGATGVLVASSGEAPGLNQLDLVGDRGMIRFDGSNLTLWSADQSVREHSRDTTEMFGMPAFASSEVSVPMEQGPNPQHAQVIQNFVDALLDETPLATDAGEGLASIELANSLLHSAWTQAPTRLPMDAASYERLLQERIGASALRKPSDREAQVDMEASYR